MKRIIFACAALALATPVFAESHEGGIPQETVDAIMSMLTDME